MHRLLDLLILIILFIPISIFCFGLGTLNFLLYRFNPLFKDIRLGRNGKRITIYKLRTMYPFDDKKFPLNTKLMTANLTPLGKIYRDHGWDELPQLFNILKGEMSFIGPRILVQKAVDTFVEEYPNSKEDILSWQKEVLKHTPGLSGWHQVHLNNFNRMQFDMEYFNDPSIKKKLYIFTKSIWIFLVGKNRYFKTKIPINYKYKL